MKYIGAFILGVIFEMFAFPNRFWYDTTSLYRGDKVQLNLPSPHDEFYRNCEATFLASQAVENDSIAFVLIQNCDVQKNGSIENPSVDLFSLKYLERKNK